MVIDVMLWQKTKKEGSTNLLEMFRLLPSIVPKLDEHQPQQTIVVIELVLQNQRFLERLLQLRHLRDNRRESKLWKRLEPWLDPIVDHWLLYVLLWVLKDDLLSEGQAREQLA